MDKSIDIPYDTVPPKLAACPLSYPDSLLQSLHIPVASLIPRESDPIHAHLSGLR